jgi:histidine triad (HIT) family protein
MSDCPFCELARDPVAGVAGSAEAFVIEPLNPVVPGHMLVIPRVHVEDFTENLAVSMAVMKAAGMYAGMHMGDCNLITSRGPAATQSVPHLHVHLVPRFAGDGLKLPWSDQAIASPADVEAVRSIMQNPWPDA